MDYIGMETNKNWYIPFDVMPKNEQDIAFDHLVSYLSRVRKRQKLKTMRAKFKGDFVKDYGYASKEVQLSAVYSNKKNTEDNEFSNATPSGTITMMISNPNAMDFIKPGEQYYVDFTLVPKEDHY